jgi:hypothetical protein
MISHLVVVDLDQMMMKGVVMVEVMMIKAKKVMA